MEREFNKTLIVGLLLAVITSAACSPITPVPPTATTVYGESGTMGQDTASAGAVMALAATSAGAAATQMSTLSPPSSLDGEFRIDEETLVAAADDFGHIVRRRPAGIVVAKSAQDVATTIRWANALGRKVAAQGQGHSVYGRAQVVGGIGVTTSRYGMQSDNVLELEIEAVVTRELAGLTAADLGEFGQVARSPFRRQAVTSPMLQLPPDDLVYAFNLVRIPTTPAADECERLVQANRAAYARIRAAGGTLYPISAFPMSRDDWRAHFGAAWASLHDAKQKYAPNHILTPGYELSKLRLLGARYIAWSAEYRAQTEQSLDERVWQVGCTTGIEQPV